MDEKQKALSSYRLEKAKEELQTANINFNHNKISQSVNRSYYAIFHAVRALLAYELFDSKRHSAIIAYFNQNFVANNLIDKAYYKILAAAFDIRLKCDYQDFYVVSKEEAKRQLDNATQFINHVEQYIISNY
jgi:uncharacterized protein (UPF0332 family)